MYLPHALRTLIKVLIIAITLSFISFISFSPLVVEASGPCYTECVTDSSGNVDKSLCKKSVCKNIDPGGGSYCVYLGDNMCVVQSSAARVCDNACAWGTNCAKVTCENAGGGTTCEFIDRTWGWDRCVEAGTSAEAELRTPNFWTSAGARAPGTELGYTLLAPSLFEGAAPTTLCTYTGRMFTVGIGIAGILAVIMLVIGGFQFIAGASNPSSRSAAKERITYAIIGLLLALASWVILNTINEDLVDGCFTPGTVTVAIPATPPSTALPAPVPQLILNDTNICVVMDPLATNVPLSKYPAYNMRTGVDATVGGVPAPCLVNVSFITDAPISQFGHVEIKYSISGAHDQTRSVAITNYDACLRSSSGSVVMWDVIGDPANGISPTGVPTLPAAAVCP